MSPNDDQPTSIVGHEKWLRATLLRHGRLGTVAASLIENMLVGQGVEFLSVTHRLKSEASALEKINRKQYSKPEVQLTDITGVRVVVFLEGQLDLVDGIIGSLFAIDAANSLDREAVLGVDRIGYRSRHYVCSLGAERASLPEYSQLAGLQFEIQVRTVLQHAWAELSHENAFKLDSALPDHIQRKLNLHSAMLEVVDKAFQEIRDDVVSYTKSLQQKSNEELLAMSIDSISVATYLDDYAARHGLMLQSNLDSGVIQEVRQFGISDIRGLDTIMSGQFVDDYKSVKDPTNTMRGVIRSALMYADIDRYLRIPHNWQRMIGSSYELMKLKYGADRMREVLREHDIDVDVTPKSKKGNGPQ